MDYKQRLEEYLSTCQGRVIDVFYEIYQIIKSYDAQVQPEIMATLFCVLEDIDSDESVPVKKSYFTKAQIERIDAKFQKKNLREFLWAQAEHSAQMSVPPEQFYQDIWQQLHDNFCRNDREWALALFHMASCKLYPYRSVGIGLSMEDEEYKKIITKLKALFFKDIEYILSLDYDQKTQQVSLLLEKMQSLPDRDSQVVYLCMLLETVQLLLRNQYQESIKQYQETISRLKII